MVARCCPNSFTENADEIVQMAHTNTWKIGERYPNGTEAALSPSLVTRTIPVKLAFKYICISNSYDGRLDNVHVIQVIFNFLLSINSKFHFHNQDLSNEYISCRSICQLKSLFDIFRVFHCFCCVYAVI